MILACQTVETFGRHTLYRYVTSFQNFKQFTRQVSLQFTFHQYFINLLIGLDCLDHGTDAEHHFVFFHSSISFPFYRRAIRLFPALCGQRYKDLRFYYIPLYCIKTNKRMLPGLLHLGCRFSTSVKSMRISPDQE